MAVYVGPILTPIEKLAVIARELEPFPYLTFEALTQLVPDLLRALPYGDIPFVERAAYFSASLSIPRTDAMRIMKIYDALGITEGQGERGAHLSEFVILSYILFN